MIDHKPIFGSFNKRENVLPISFIAKVQLTQFQILRIQYRKRKKILVADLVGCSLTGKEVQLNQLRRKQFLPHSSFATLTQNKQAKPVQYLVKHETVLPSRKDDCHPTVPDFGNDQMSIRIKKGGQIILKPLVSSSFEPVKPFESQYEKPIRKSTKTSLQQSVVLHDTNISQYDDSFREKDLNR